ncbi:MAG: hypothetical protein A3H31_09850 [Gallionellales bacterium RIFCSPLOWO2_02_FULL_57_47]|nr:MAG: hypothetical protein A3H31_09850 [Gallionellales bacterium RIFCSPLOWO2_02_FULL_57_47]OGT18431.1 MAG: hypothetical protein A3J49_18935 [Gallionellales bacterium RIFCSPHIGHO2_02_FULL_57_16]
MSLQKISFKVPPGLWESFSKQASGLFLNRAPFLNHMIARETGELAEDLSQSHLSLRAKGHIRGALKMQGAKSVNIEVEQSTAKALNEVVSEANLIRDAFFCRLIIFLRSSDALLKYLEIPREAGIFGDNLERMPSSPMRAMEAVRDDPLFYIRHYVKERWGCGIYAVRLPRELDWAACYIEDKEAPGTKAYKDVQRQSAEMFELLEAKAFKKSPVLKRRHAK